MMRFFEFGWKRMVVCFAVVLLLVTGFLIWGAFKGEDDSSEVEVVNDGKEIDDKATDNKATGNEAAVDSAGNEDKAGNENKVDSEDTDVVDVGDGNDKKDDSKKNLTETIKKPIVYLSGNELYVCDEDGSKKECLAKDEHQNNSQIEYIEDYDICRISEDQRFIVYQNQFFESRALWGFYAELCIYDLKTKQVYHIDHHTSRFRITKENILLLEDNSASIYWIALNQIDSYVKEEKGNDPATITVVPKSVSYASADVDFRLNFDEIFISKDSKQMVITWSDISGTVDKDKYDFLDKAIELTYMGNTSFIASVDLNSQKTANIWENVHSYHIDYENKEVYFLLENVLYHLNSDFVISKVKEGIDYFYLDSTTDYLVYLTEQKQEKKSIILTDLVEIDAKEEYDKEFLNKEMYKYGIYDLTIEYQNEKISYPSLKLYPDCISVEGERVLLLYPLRKSFEKISTGEYWRKQESDGYWPFDAFDSQYLIGTKLVSVDKLKGYTVANYDEEAERVTAYCKTSAFDKNSQIAKIVKRNGNKATQSAIVDLDINTGKVVNHYLYDDNNIKYTEQYGQEFLALFRDFEAHGFHQPGKLYYGTQLLDNNAALVTVRKVNDGIIYLTDYSQESGIGDLYYCDEKGQSQLIDTDVTDYYVADHGVVYYLKGISEKDVKLYSYNQGKSLCLNINADAIIMHEDKTIYNDDTVPNTFYYD